MVKAVRDTEVHEVAGRGAKAGRGGVDRDWKPMRDREMIKKYKFTVTFHEGSCGLFMWPLFSIEGAHHIARRFASRLEPPTEPRTSSPSSTHTLVIPRLATSPFPSIPRFPLTTHAASALALSPRVNSAPHLIPLAPGLTSPHKQMTIFALPS